MSNETRCVPEQKVSCKGWSLSVELATLFPWECSEGGERGRRAVKKKWKYAQREEEDGQRHKAKRG